MYKSASDLFKLLLQQMSSDQSKFVIAVLSKKYETAKLLALDLYKKQPNYLLFYYFLNQDENKALLLKVLKSITHQTTKTKEIFSKEANLITESTKKVDPLLIIHLLKSEKFSYEDLSFLENAVDENSFIGLCVKKYFFLKKYTNSNDISMLEGNLFESSTKLDINENYITSANNTSDTMVSADNFSNESFNTKLHMDYTPAEIDRISSELNSLIDKIDDFLLYKFAIDNKIKINQRDSPNFLWYKLITENCQESAKKLILLSKSFTDISKIITFIPDISTGNTIYDILLEYLRSSYSKNLLFSAYKIFNEDKSFLNTKVVLALLIASREEKYLVLATYIAYTTIFEENYEILLIALFLSRYFLIFSKIKAILKDLDIKNIQQHNLAYIWSDVMIIKKIEQSELVKTFKKEIGQEIAETECHLEELIEKCRIAIAASLIKLRDRLKESIIFKEVDNLQILSEHPSTMFTNLLGKDCSYLFNKVTKDYKASQFGSIETLYSYPVIGFNSDIFKNDLCDISDQKFISTFELAASRKKRLF